MKKITQLLLLIILSAFATSYGQTPLLPPGVEWQQGYSPSFDPINKVAITEDQTGEDWWYDHKNSYDNLGLQDGFITAGYFSFVNAFPSENNEGCIITDAPNPNTCYNSYQNIPSIYFPNGNTIFSGVTSLTAIAKLDIKGNKIWDKTFDVGLLFRVIQSADGGYVAIGETKSSIDVNTAAPIYYNKTVGGQGTVTDCRDCNTTHSNYRAKNQLFIVKVDALGNLIWKYRYGLTDFGTPEWCLTENNGFDIVELGTPGNYYYRAVGKCYSPSIGNVGYILDVNNQGEKLSQTTIAAPFLSGNASFVQLFAICKTGSPGSETVAITGTYGHQNATTFSLATDIPILSYTSAIPGQTGLYTLSTLGLAPGWPTNSSFGLAFRNNNNLLVACLTDCNTGCFGAGNNIAKGQVTEYNLLSQSVVNNYYLPQSPLHAFDLKMGITNTTDGGFATVSSVVPLDYRTQYLNGSNPTWICNTNTYQVEPYWNSDAYFVKFDVSGNIEWEKVVNSEPDEAPAPITNGFPGDIKKQECMYSITQSDDGGLVAAGNYSENFDDCYLIKLYNDCDSRYLAALRATNDPTLYDATTTTFTTDIWTTPKKVFGPLVIPTGETLTIQTDVKFFDSKAMDQPTFVQVAGGGKLIIENASRLDVIEECSNRMWDGISVLGDPLQMQNLNIDGEVLITNNSIIANARIGVMASDYQYIDYHVINPANTFGGGIIRTESGTTFLNNRRSVFFAPYPDRSVKALSNNLSYIRNTSFINDAVLKDDNYYIYENNARIQIGSSQMVSGFSHNRVIISDDSQFIVNATNIPSAYRATGLVSIDAGYTILDCSFSELLNGIRNASNSGSLSNRIIVQRSTFNAIPYNIYTYQGVFHYIYNNTFNNIPSISGANQNAAYGVWCNESQAAYVAFNSFSGNNASSIGNKVGTVVTNSLMTGSLVEHNEFHDLEVGSQTERNNAGLIIKCNKYTNHDYAWLINPQNIGVLADQGTGCTQLQIRAGNEFYDPTCNPLGSNYSHIYCPTGVEFAYYSKGNGTAGSLDPTCTDPVLRNGNIKDVWLCGNNLNDPSCDFEPPCNDPPCEYLRMATDTTVNAYSFLNINHHIQAYLGRTDSLNLDSLALNYIVQLPDSFYQEVYTQTLYEDTIAIGNRTAISYENNLESFPAFNASLEKLNNINSQRNQLSDKRELNNKVKIYPNPNNGELRIDLLNLEKFEELYEVKVVNIMGQVLINLPQHYINTDKVYDFTHLPPGLYIISITSNSGLFYTSQFSINK